MAKKKVTSVKTDPQKQKPKQTEKIPEQKSEPINEINPLVYSNDDLASFERLDNLFHVHEDNWAVSQDGILHNLILSENGVNDSQRIRYLLRLYRNLQREVNNC